MLQGNGLHRLSDLCMVQLARALVYVRRFAMLGLEMKMRYLDVEFVIIRKILPIALDEKVIWPVDLEILFGLTLFD